MNAVTAFENRKDTLREQLEASENMPQAISAATMTLEQIACDLAQDEQDDFARQRQQAVMALAKRLPMSLRAGGSGRSLRAGRTLRRAYAQAERTAALTVNPASI